MARLPEWIRCSLRTDEQFAHVQNLLDGDGLHTVCQDAQCPNRLQCWNSGTATLMILGDTCTRDCRFCAVKSGQPGAPDEEEPRRVVRAASAMGLQHLVITSVTRDDLPDGGGGIFAQCLEAVHAELPDTTTEVLVPDFQGSYDSLAMVLRAGPTVLNHNIETVERLQPLIRPQAAYARSLGVLRAASEWPEPIAVKSGIMAGLGETDSELFRTLEDLLEAGCRMLTIGQYLAPSKKHWPIARYVPPEQFDKYAADALAMGFEQVQSSPLTRSSYKAADMAATIRKEVCHAG